MSKDFQRIRRRLGHTEQKQLYVTYDGYCQCNCQCCRNKAFSDDEMQSKRYILDEVLKKNYKQFRHIVFGGGEPLYKIDKIWRLITELDMRNEMEANFDGEDDDEKVTYYSIVTNGARELFLEELDHNCATCRRFQTIILSRYHYDDEINKSIFRPRSNEELLSSEDLEEICHSMKKKIQLSCLCQKGGINTLEDVIEYIQWAAKLGITNVMFSNFQDDVTPDLAKENLSCDPKIFQKAMKELSERGFESDKPIAFSAGFKLTTFDGIIETKKEVEGTFLPPELQLVMSLIGMEDMVPSVKAEAVVGRKMTVSFKEYIPEDLLRAYWKSAKRRTYNYSAMPNGDLFSDWSCGKKL